MAIIPGTERVLEAAEHWKQTFLLNQRGVLENNEYTSETFDELKRRVVDNPLEGKGISFLDRLEKQMEGASPIVCKLLGEILWILFLTVNAKKMKQDTKRRQIRQIWNLSGSELPESEYLQDDVLRGIGYPGTAFKIFAWRELNMAVLLFLDWWNLSDAEKEKPYNNHMLFAQWIDGKEYAEGRSFRHMLLYLLFPEHFEKAFSEKEKLKILTYFKKDFKKSHSKADQLNLDITLKELRSELEPKYGKNFDFYTILDNTKRPATPKKVGKHQIGENVQEPQKTLSLNRIFYGPPGTGKTYRTIKAAVEILDPEFYEHNENNRKKLRNRFDKLKEKKRVDFVTFHQSFGYEDFIEGIKANTEGGKISYAVEDGIFKRLCDRAAAGEDYLSIQQAIKKLKEECSDKPIPMKTVSGKNIDITYEGGKTFRINTETGENTSYPASIEGIISVYLGQDYREIYNPSYVRAILNHLKKNYDIGDPSLTTNDEPHVLIIDEINRGNISSIFGELITLIEPSKRQGEEEELSVKLPYSKEPFSVPNNVFLIGTMNTADRSLAILDTALRRRFEFIEMMPNLDILQGLMVENINIAEMLEAMNNRIEALHDREHTIGHTFFLPLKKNSGIEMLKRIFELNIIPLLQEYFFDDWNKIRNVLNDDKKPKEVLQFIREKRTADPQPLYRLNPDALTEPDAYRLIYDDAKTEPEEQ